MTKNIFSGDVFEKIKENPCVEKCTSKSIAFTYDFKKNALERYNQGVSSKEIFRGAGFDLNMWRIDYPRECLKRWRKIVKKKGFQGLVESRETLSTGRPKSKDLTDQDQIKRLQLQVVYLSVIKDIASGEVVAWNLSLYLEMTLVTETIKNMRLSSYDNIMIHSDQGFHYTNPVYIGMVKELNMIQSMSGKGNCIDNAPIESFFGHMKDELDYQSCKTFEELHLMVEKYVRYYNQERKQWERKKMTPVEYRNHLLAQV